VAAERKNHALTSQEIVPDPHQDRRAEFHRLAPTQRIAAIDRELTAMAPDTTAASTFHRKKLLRMRDAARLEAGLTTNEGLQRENSSFARHDFSQARIVWKPRVLAGE
jgi:hypothetical protein